MAKNLDIIVLFDIYGDMLTQKQQDFISYYYNDDLSLAEIAENEGITRQGVRDAIRHGVETLHSLEKELGIFVKNERIAALASELKTACDNERVASIADKIIAEVL